MIYLVTCDLTYVSLGICRTKLWCQTRDISCHVLFNRLHSCAYVEASLWVGGGQSLYEELNSINILGRDANLMVYFLAIQLRNDSES